MWYAADPQLSQKTFLLEQAARQPSTPCLSSPARSSLPGSASACILHLHLHALCPASLGGGPRTPGGGAACRTHPMHSTPVCTPTRWCPPPSASRLCPSLEAGQSRALAWAQSTCRWHCSRRYLPCTCHTQAAHALSHAFDEGPVTAAHGLGAPILSHSHPEWPPPGCPPLHTTPPAAHRVVPLPPGPRPSSHTQPAHIPPA